MLECIYKEEINMKSELDIMELKLTVLDKMGMKHAIEFILNESEFYEY